MHALLSIDLTQILSEAINGSPIIVIVLGLTQWFKETFSITSNRWANITSMLIGLLAGGGYLIVQNPPTDALTWFLDGVYGVVLGLVASGIFKMGRQLATHVGLTMASSLNGGASTPSEFPPPDVPLSGSAK